MPDASEVPEKTEKTDKVAHVPCLQDWILAMFKTWEEAIDFV